MEERKILLRWIFLLMICFGLISSTAVYAGEKIDLLLKQGIELSNEGNYKTAVRKFKKILEIDPKNWEAHLNLGLIYFSMQKYDSALNELNYTIELSSTNATAYYSLGLLYEGKGLSEEKSLEKARKCNRKALDMWRKVLWYEQDKKKKKIARKHIERLEKISGKEK